MAGGHALSVTDPFRLTAHSEDEISQRDVDLATWIEDAASADR